MFGSEIETEIVHDSPRVVVGSVAEELPELAAAAAAAVVDFAGELELVAVDYSRYRFRCRCWYSSLTDFAGASAVALLPI